LCKLYELSVSGRFWVGFIEDRRKKFPAYKPGDRY
jgi:hypothetical protein